MFDPAEVGKCLMRPIFENSNFYVWHQPNTANASRTMMYGSIITKDWASCRNMNGCRKGIYWSLLKSFHLSAGLKQRCCGSIILQWPNEILISIPLIVYGAILKNCSPQLSSNQPELPQENLSRRMGKIIQYPKRLTWYSSKKWLFRILLCITVYQHIIALHLLSNISW